MIRIILYRLGTNGEWTEGIIHTFSGTNAVVENKATGALSLVPVSEDTLKFKILTEDWVKIQVDMQRQAQAASVLAGAPPSADGRFRR